MNIPVSEKLKIYREMRSMTQKELADRAGINLSTIKKYETNLLNPKPNQLKKLADALGVSIYMFMDFEVNTLGDAMSLLMKVFEAIPVKFNVKDAKSYMEKRDKMPLVFDNAQLNELLFNYLNAQFKASMLHDRPDLGKDNLAFIRAAADADLFKLEMGLNNQPIIRREKSEVDPQETNTEN